MIVTVPDSKPSMLVPAATIALLAHLHFRRHQPRLSTSQRRRLSRCGCLSSFAAVEEYTLGQRVLQKAARHLLKSRNRRLSQTISNWRDERKADPRPPPLGGRV
jgi:hypothetical protein